MLRLDLIGFQCVSEARRAGGGDACEEGGSCEGSKGVSPGLVTDLKAGQTGLDLLKGGGACGAAWNESIKCPYNTTRRTSSKTVVGNYSLTL